MRTSRPWWRSRSRRGARVRLDLEEDDALRPAELLQHSVELAAREAGPRGNRESRPLEHLGGLAPVEKAAEQVGSDYEDPVVEVLGSQQLDRAWIGILAGVVMREGRLGQREAILGRCVDRSMTGVLVHEHDEALDSEALARGVGDRDMPEMRRVERASVQDYSHSSSSSPTSTSSPARAPAARRIASSSSSAGGVPMTRKPLSVR